MRNNIPAQMKEMLAGEEHAGKLAEKGEYAQVEKVLLAIRDDARKMAWSHAQISHRLSLACFRQERLEEALEFICEAMAQDPINGGHQKGYRRVVQRMREVIEAEEVDPTDLQIPRYHALLAREDETTVETHLALLRHLAAVGDHEGMKRISKALARLHPGHPEVWRFRAGPEDGAAPPADPAIAALALFPTTTAKA